MEHFYPSLPQHPPFLDSLLSFSFFLLASIFLSIRLLLPRLLDNDLPSERVFRAELSSLHFALVLLPVDPYNSEMCEGCRDTCDGVSETDPVADSRSDKITLSLSLRDVAISLNSSSLHMVVCREDGT